MERDREERETRRAFANRLKRILEAIPMSQSELGRRLGIAQSAISDWFTKGAVPEGETLIRIFRLPEFRHISAEYFLTGLGSEVRSTNISNARLHTLGGIDALVQAAEEIEHLKQLWLTAQQGETRPGGAAAARAAEAAEATRRTRSAGRKRA